MRTGPWKSASLDLALEASTAPRASLDEERQQVLTYQSSSEAAFQLFNG